MLLQRLSSLLLVALIFNLPSAQASTPSAPTDVSVTSTSPAGTAVLDASARITWNHSGENSIGFIVRYRTGSETPTTLILDSTLSRQAQIENLRGGQSYIFTVSALSSTGIEATSSQANHVARSVPSAPTIVSAEAGIGEVFLKWNSAQASETGGLDLLNYVLLSDQGNTETVSATSTEKRISGLTAGSTHNFTITAVNSLGSSVAATFEKVTVFDRPTPPTGLTIAASSRTITGTWTAPSSDGGSPITGYRVFLVSVSSGLDIDSKTTEASARTIDFTNVTNGVYQIQIIAVNNVGNSNRSLPSPNQIINVSEILRSNIPVFSPNDVSTLRVDETLALTVSTPSGDDPTITVTANPEGACTYSAGTLTAIFSGTCSIRASVSANTDFSDGETTISLTILKLTQAIIFSTIEDQDNAGVLSLSAISSAGLNIIYSVSGSCSVSGSTLTTQVGDCLVIASQPGNSRVSAAESVSRSFKISAGNANSGGSSFSSIFPPLSLNTTETAPAISATLVQLQVEGLSSPSAQPLLGSCVEIQASAPTVSPIPKQCGLDGIAFDYNLIDGNYLVLLSDRDGKRESRQFTLIINRGQITFGPGVSLIIGSRYAIQAGAIVGSASTDSGTAASADKNPGDVTSESESGSNSTTSSNASSPMEQPLKDSSGIKVIKKASSTLNPVTSPYFLSQKSAKQVSRFILKSNSSATAISLKNAFQVQIPILSKSNLLTMKVRKAGKPPTVLLRNFNAKRGKFDSHLLQFKSKGEYVINIVAGKKKYIIRLKVTR